jgi:dipicolinate synthase subunit A
MSGELSGWTVAVLGGELRMLEHMRQARAAGANVQHYGDVPGAAEAAGAPQSSSLAEAVKGARIISCPIPGVGSDDSLYAGYTKEKLFCTTEVLSGAAKGAMLFSGRITKKMHEWAKGTPVEMVAYGDDDPLAIAHAVPTAEGAIKVAIENTETTLLGLHMLCIGLGRVGMSVAQAFEAMKAHVTLGVRNPSQLTRAWAMGLTPMPLADLGKRIGEFPLIVSSASGLVMTEAVLAKVDPKAVIIDLCSPPGSVDFPAAEKLGRKVIWARAQAGTAPRTAGYNEWQVVMRIVREKAPDLASRAGS